MATDIDALLGSYDDSDYSVRLVRGVCAVVPFAPEVPSTYSLVEVLKARDEKASRKVLDAARAFTASPEAGRALWMLGAVDTADAGIGVFSGLRAAVKLRAGERMDALETDPQQAADAVLKGLALAYAVYKLFPGGPTEKVAAFRALPSGQALLFYYAAIEVGLPFADNALTGGGELLAQLFAKFGGDQEAKLATLTSPEEAQEAAGVLQRMLEPMGSVVTMASGHLKSIGDAAAQHLPTALDVGDKVAGVAATGADLLPVWRYLGARLVADAAVAHALATVTVASEQAARHNPALAPIVYTKSSDTLPDAPPKRRGCLPFLVALLALPALWSLWS